MKKVLLTLAISLFVLQMSAQLRSAYSTARFYKGWFVGLNAGQTLFLAEGNTFNETSVFSFKQNGGYAIRAEIGYNFTPIFSLRGMIANNHYNWPDTRFPDGFDSFKNVSFQSENITLDGMIDLKRMVNKYDYRQNFKIYAFAGIGVAYRNKGNFSTDLISPLVRGGLQASVKLGSDLDLNLIADGNFVADSFNDYKITFPFDMYSSLTLGLTYHMRQVGRNGW